MYLKATEYAILRGTYTKPNIYSYGWPAYGEPRFIGAKTTTLSVFALQFLDIIRQRVSGLLEKPLELPITLNMQRSHKPRVISEISSLRLIVSFISTLGCVRKTVRSSSFRVP